MRRFIENTTDILCPICFVVCETRGEFAKCPTCGAIGSLGEISEVFTYRFAYGRVLQFDIETAERMVRNRKPNWLQPDQVAAALASNTDNGVDIGYAMTTDLNKAIIAVCLPLYYRDPRSIEHGGGQHVVIDGWHRIAKAALAKRGLFIHVLTETETKQVILSDIIHISDDHK